jgi:hypothetical protein
MAKFVTVVGEGNVTYIVNVDQIAHMRRGPNDRYTVITFSGDKEHILAVPQPPGVFTIV